MSNELTLRQYVDFLAPEIWGTRRKPLIPAWPPDMFAVIGSILNITGAYRRIISAGALKVDWPSAAAGSSWQDEVYRLGKAWRKKYDPFGKNNLCPKEVEAWWRELTTYGDQKLSSVCSNLSACNLLYNLMAVSDQACAGIGFPGRLHDWDAGEDFFNFKAARQIILYTGSSYGATLCDLVHPSRVRVLPKLHTPRTGLTLRSLSLHLALCPADEVKISWAKVDGSPWASERSQGEPASQPHKNLNLLLIPWPMETYPSDVAISPAGLDGTAHSPQHLFAYKPQSRTYKGVDIIGLTLNLLKVAERVVGPSGIDGIVLPEMAISPREYRRLRIIAANRNILLVCGIRGEHGGYGTNKVGIYLGTRSAWGGNVVNSLIDVFQNKHHRWMMDHSQITNYGLVSKLHPDHIWWEGIDIPRRSLRFVAFSDWLCLCALICEDLARQEPIACAVRAVGPSLLIALLMDGPQIGNRWSSHYATVFADDPGTSVLTLTSLGMVKLSHAMRPSGSFKVSRTVASWKDRQSGLIEIDLPIHDDGIILCLTNKNSTEMSADGRVDHRNENLLVLGGIHTIALDAKEHNPSEGKKSTRSATESTSSKKARRRLPPGAAE